NGGSVLVAVVGVARRNPEEAKAVEVTAERTSRKLELQAVSKLTEAEEGLRLAVAADVVSRADARNDLIAPSEIDRGRNAIKRWQVLFLKTKTGVDRKSADWLPAVLNVD